MKFSQKHVSVLLLAFLVALLPLRVAYAVHDISASGFSGAHAPAAALQHEGLGDAHAVDHPAVLDQAVPAASPEGITQSHDSHSGHCASCFVAFTTIPSFIFSELSSAAIAPERAEPLDALLKNSFRPPRA